MDNMKTDIELEGLYKILGEEYYRIAFYDPMPQLLPLFDKISKTTIEYTGTICRNCGAELIDNAKFCHICGTKVSNETQRKKCNNCGKIIETSSLFCSNCGCKL